MLRPYQQQTLDKLKEKLSFKEPVCVVAATGSGKSHLLAEICKGATTKGNKVLVLAHRKELLVQNNDKFENLGAIYCAGLNQKEIALVTFGSIASVFGNKEAFLGTKLILIDECHRVAVNEEGRYRELIAFLNPDYVIGFTATPYRLTSSDNVSIIGKNCFFKQVVIGSSVSELIKQEYLCPLISRPAEKQVSLLGITKKSTGDYADAELEEAMLNIEDEAIKEIIKLTSERKKVIIFASGVKHAKQVASDLSSAVSITGDDNSLFRSSQIQAFKDGHLKYLVGCEIFTEGFDIIDIDCVVLLRATCSLALFHQIVGRGLRIAPNKKDCLILDFGQNFRNHGTLEDFTIKEKGIDGIRLNQAPQKICDSCSCLQPLAAKVCSHCGFVFPEADSKLKEEAYYGAIVTENTIYNVSSIAYKHHKAKTGRDCLKVTYYTEELETINEWVSIPDVKAAIEGNYSEQFVGKKLCEWFVARGLKEEFVYDMETIGDVFLGLNQIKHPSKINAIKDGKYKRVSVAELGSPEVDIDTELAGALEITSWEWKS